MHIEKNVCDSVLGILLNMKDKTKDGVNARLDMVDMGIRPELAPLVRRNRKLYYPPACYTLSKVEKTEFCTFLHGVKVLSGYSANLKRLVSMKDLKLIGMKSHDCHVMMTQMLPIAIRCIKPDYVKLAVTRLCHFFNAIAHKVIDPAELSALNIKIAETLCLLEMVFPLSLFDMMVHLLGHIVDEIKILGPEFLHQMYPFERYMAVLKRYVRNRTNPEGCMIKGYHTEEVVGSCTDYIDGTQ